MSAALCRTLVLMGLLAVGGAGCDDGAASSEGGSTWSGEQRLAGIEDWVRLDADADPFDDMDDDATCAEHGYGAEDGVFEVETDICQYGSFAVMLPVELLPGDRITTTLWHLALWAPMRAEGHVALMAGSTMLWERHFAIPAEEAVHPIDVEVTEPVPVGSPLIFHLHNHGANSWRLLEVDAHRGAAE